MAHDEELAHRVRAALGAEVVTEQRMFGGLAFLVRGHLALAASQDGLLVHVDASDDGAEALLARPGVEPAVMGRRTMRGWVRVRPEGFADDDALAAWVARGLAYARSLPPGGGT